MTAHRVIVAALLSALPASAGDPVKLTDYFPPPESKGGWRTLLPDHGLPSAAQKAAIRDKAGMDWDKLAKAWEHNLRAEGPSMLLVIRRGYIAGEWYNEEWLKKWGRHRAPGFYSSTKAYISVAFGLLLDDSDQGKLPGGKKLTLDTKVCNQEWMPEALPLSDPRRADITLRHLLFATSGIPREGLKIPDEAKNVAGPFEMALGHTRGSPWAKLTGPPGTMFNYSSPGVLHLILVFNHAAGMDLLPYIRKRLCDPIGMENVGWGKTGGKGNNIGPYCSPGAFNCSGRDHARFLYLAMHRGNWAGKQVVPAGYYDWAFRGTKANPAYGAQWWLAARYQDVPADFVQTYGHLYNDGCLVPSLDLVFVRLGRAEKFPPGFQRDLVKKVLAAVEK
ncbi:MAG: beta-lactamase family protein [Gemmataceae bacterium]|nr:beta-lactamase family protein [Gemmataceae bacterium]